MSPIGNQLDRYKILERLGEGGMSIVYRGLDTTLNREVAIKVMHSFLAPRADARHRFEREAQAVARLSHPNILEVYDYARGDGTDSFIVTELIRGKTLRELATERPFGPPELAALIIHEIALALAHAHRAGIIHRDLKPENVMVRNDGVLKLMDFGIAKIIEADTQMTATGTLLGSPAHMAPEVIEGKPVSPATDIFSLGTMLYFLATGSLPFNSDSPAATFMKIIEGNYDDPRALNGAISDDFAQVITTSMNTAPADRYQDADAFAAALSKITKHLGVDDAAKELRAYFSDRAGHEQKLISHIVTRNLEQAQKAAREKRTANSLSAINIVLTHDPDNVAAKELLASMQHRKRREALQKKILRSGAFAALCAAVIAGGVFGVYRYQQYRLATEREAAQLEEEQREAAKREADKRDEAIRESAQREAAAKYAKQIAERPQAAPLTPTPSTALEHLRPKAPGLIPVNVAIRPFGRLKIDNQPPTEDELALHRLKLSPGKHQFLVLCDRCDTNAKPVEKTVVPGEDISLVAPLLHAKVSFVGFPENAKYIVNGTPVKKEHTITRPAGGQTSMRYTVNYEVKMGTTPIERGQRFVLPGDTATITQGATK